MNKKTSEITGIECGGSNEEEQGIKLTQTMKKVKFHFIRKWTELLFDNVQFNISIPYKNRKMEVN